MFCLYCGKRIIEPHGHPSDGFCSSAHRVEYYLRLRPSSEPAKGLAGFKPPIAGIELEVGQLARIQDSARELRLPGAWYLSLLPKRGIRARASFRDLRRPETAKLPPPRPILTGAPAILTRIENWVTQHSGDPGWNVRPRLTPPRNGSSLPLVVPPSIRPVASWEHPTTVKLDRGRRINNFPAATLEILPELPALGMKPEKVIEPEYCLPVSEFNSVTNGVSTWVRRSLLSLPVDRSSWIPGLQTRDRHIPHSPQPAAGPESSLIVTESRLAPSRSSRAGFNASAALPAILNPGPTRPPKPVTPSPIGPRLQSSDPNTPSLVDVHPSPHVFAAARPFRDAAIPEAQTTAALPGPRVWFAVRVPSPYALETPMPLDMSKGQRYVHAARHTRSAGIPAEVVSHPAGLRAADIRILQATPDPLPDSAVFRAFARTLTGNSVPALSEPHPPTGNAAQPALAPVDQRPEIADSFINRDVERFPMGPAILWATPLQEVALRETGPATLGIRPVPDSPEFSHFPHRFLAEPAWVFQLASSIGASFAISVARTCEPETGRVAIADIAHRPWRKTADRASGSDRMPQPVRLAPALAPFRRIAHPESMQSSFATDLRDRIFSPLLPPIPRTHLRPASVETSGFRLRESHTFAPLDFRWQRNRKMKDRGAPWKLPAGIGSLPECELPDWPGALSDGGLPN